MTLRSVRRAGAWCALFILMTHPGLAHAKHTSGSTVDANGNTVTFTKNADGTTTRSVTSPKGEDLGSEVLQPEPVTQVAPREPGTSGSTTDEHGNTVTYKKNPDGTTTRTVTSPKGEDLGSEVLQPEPVTQVPPRTGGDSASTVDADGNTIKVEAQADGSRVRTVTAPDGTVLKTEVVDPPQVDAQVLYDSLTQNDVTLTAAMLLVPGPLRTLLEVSLLATGKGAQARNWEPDAVNLVVGDQKLKPTSTTPYYANKESIAQGVAPVVFAVLGALAARQAEHAVASKGTACAASGGSGGGGHERERGKFGEAIETAGLASGMALLAGQAKGQITGKKVVFDVTGSESALVNGQLVVRVKNTDPSPPLLSKIPVINRFMMPARFKVNQELLLLIRPTVVQQAEDE